jgi:hypothetical protein
MNCGWTQAWLGRKEDMKAMVECSLVAYFLQRYQYPNYTASNHVVTDEFLKDSKGVGRDIIEVPSLILFGMTEEEPQSR